MQRRFGQVGDVRGHARDRQAAPRLLAGAEVGPALPVRIGHDGLASDLVKGDVLSRVVGGGGERNRRAHALGILRGPFEHLHPAHGAADHREKLVDSQVIEQEPLRLHHVGDGHDREVEAPGFAGLGIEIGRTGCAHAAAQHIGADHEEAVAVQNAARPHHQRPPSSLAGHGMRFGGELVAGQGMANQDRVRLVGVELAIGLIGHRDWTQLRAAGQAQRSVLGQGHPVARQVLDALLMAVGGK